MRRVLGKGPQNFLILVIPKITITIYQLKSWKSPYSSAHVLRATHKIKVLKYLPNFSLSLPWHNVGPYNVGPKNVGELIMSAD